MSRILNRNWGPITAVGLLAAGMYCVSNARGVTAWYASATGSGSACTFSNPCTLGWVFGQSHVQPGDTVWVRGGTYLPGNTGTTSFKPTWNGTAENPIIVRNYNNEHVLIDCSADLVSTGSSLCLGMQNTWGNYVTMWGFDVNNSNAFARIQTKPGSNVCDHNEQCNNGIVPSAIGVKIINSFSANNYNGMSNSGDPTASFYSCGYTVYGNMIYNNGLVGIVDDRSHGHNLYLENNADLDEHCRSVIQDNLERDAFDIGQQDYSAGNGGVGYMTNDHNVYACDGHPVWNGSPPYNWPACGASLSPAMAFHGNSGAPATQCGPLTPQNKICNNCIVNGVMVYSTANTAPYNLGYNKGSCNAMVTNNYFATPGDFGFTNDATFGSPTITGNTFFHTLNGSGGSSPVLNLTNYPSNTVQAFPPSPNTNVIFYRPNQYETGRGFAVVYDWHHDLTVPIDLSQMGTYPDESYVVFTWMDPNPWTGSPIAMGTCVGTCGTIAVPIAAPTEEHLAGDGTTVPDPPDTGLSWFQVYIVYPDWGKRGPVVLRSGYPTPRVVTNR